jgi:hypothetical protein
VQPFLEIAFEKLGFVELGFVESGFVELAFEKLDAVDINDEKTYCHYLNYLISREEIINSP